MVDKRSFFILIFVLALAFASFIFAEYAQDPRVEFNGIAFLNPTPANNSFVNNGSNLFIVNASGNLSFNPPTSTFNLTIYTWNAVGGIFNITNITSPNVRGGISIIAPDGAYNVTINMSNETFSNFTARYNITVDSRNPNITLTYPLANANLSFFNITVNSTSQDTNLNDTVLTIYNN